LFHWLIANCSQDWRQAYDQIASSYQAGGVHPGDLKKALVGWIDTLISPVRTHFETNPHAQNILAKISSF
jgi:tyrosyl-tRNA synthetase